MTEPDNTELSMKNYPVGYYCETAVLWRTLLAESQFVTYVVQLDISKMQIHWLRHLINMPNSRAVISEVCNTVYWRQDTFRK